MMMTNTSNPDVSIVLCTYNRAHMLAECIESLMAQRSYGEFTFEIVVVDNRSTDNTAAIVAELASRSSVAIRYVLENQPGQVHARHRGFDEARGEWIANFDDDEVAEPDWLVEMLRLARNKNVLSVGGLLLLRFTEQSDRQLHPRVRRILGESVRWSEPRPYTRRQGPGSGTQLLHKSVLERVGRYDVTQSLRGYDTDFYRRMREAGIESWFAPKSVAYHITPSSRLTYKYLHDTCFHDGWTFCRRDLEHFGKLICFFVLIVRFALVFFKHLPLSIVTRLAGMRESALAHRLMLARLEGYTRCYFHMVAPRLVMQRRALERYGVLPSPKHAH